MYLKYIKRVKVNKRIRGNLKTGGQEKIHILKQKHLRALNSNDCIELTAPKCEDVFTEVEF